MTVGESVFVALPLALIGALAVGEVSSCNSDTWARAHDQGVCDQACHAHARVLESNPLKCLCPNDRVVTVRGKP